MEEAELRRKLYNEQLKQEKIETRILLLELGKAKK